MKFLFAIFIFFCAACSTATPHIDLIGGIRQYDSTSTWEQTNKQNAFGIQANYTSPNGFGPEIVFISSNDTSYDEHYYNRPVDYTKSRTEEASLGLRKNFMLADKLQAYVSGGGSVTNVRTTASLTYTDNKSDKSIAIAPYAQAGFNYLLDKHFTCGILYRRTFWGEDEDVFIHNPSTENNLFALTIGYSF